MTQRDDVLRLLHERKRVTLREFFDAGIGYTARNRISELRKEGFKIRQENGETPSGNAYILVSEPLEVKTDQSGQQSFI